jgi:hypothetical protein
MIHRRMNTTGTSTTRTTRIIILVSISILSFVA